MVWGLFLCIGPAHLGLTLFRYRHGVQTLGAYSYRRDTEPRSFYFALIVNLFLGIILTGAMTYGAYDTFFVRHSG